MKQARNGQAKVLNDSELSRLFEAFECSRDRALFGICLFTGCRINEALSLDTQDVRDSTIIFRKAITKGKLRTRVVTVNPKLKKYLSDYKPEKAGPMFPGKKGMSKYLKRQTVDLRLRQVCTKLGIEGVSTHSFRRTALTKMADSGIPLSHIQKISGHGDLGVLQLYLEVSDQQIGFAVSQINF